MEHFVAALLWMRPTICILHTIFFVQINFPVWGRFKMADLICLVRECDTHRRRHARNHQFLRWRDCTKAAILEIFQNFQFRSWLELEPKKKKLRLHFLLYSFLNAPLLTRFTFNGASNSVVAYDVATWGNNFMLNS